MNYAILLAGGTGSRITSEIPKQYIKAGPYMMITVALKAMLENDHIYGVCIVADADWREEIKRDAASAGLDTDRILSFADPGDDRQLSILNGMNEIIGVEGEPSDTDTVLVHDAARPFITADLLSAVYGSLDGHDGVMPVLPMKDTVYYSENGSEVSELLDRGKIFAGQAPELFLFGKYYEANKALLPEKILSVNGASEPAIIAGMDIVMIPGDEGNFKVTTDADVDRYLMIVKDR